MIQSASTTINELAEHLHGIARSKGFYDVDDAVLREVVDYDTRQQIKIALEQASFARMHSELSEAVEAIRHGNPMSEKIIGYTHVEEEIADAIIRLLDYSAAQKFDIGGAIVAKSEYNEGREYLHGKNS
jgi:NTP pyrophosphatase (non-canonical NTP hydrolase)